MATQLAVALTSVATLAAGPQSPAPSRVDAAVPFRVGETLTYDVTLASLLVAGTAIATVKERRAAGGSTAYAIEVEGRPLPLLARLYTVFYRMETWLDSATLLPHRTSMYAEEGAGKRLGVTQFDRGSLIASLDIQGDTTERLEFPIPPQAQDGLSAIYVLRSMNVRAGDSFTLPVADYGSLYSVRADVGPAERVRVPFGETSAWNISVSITDDTGVAAATNAAVWLSTDARRLPVKIQADLPVGSFVLLLRQVTP